MDHPRLRGWAVLRHLAVPALALAVVATLPMTRSGDAPTAAAEYAPGMAPASVSYGLPAGPTVKGRSSATTTSTARSTRPRAAAPP